MWLLEYGNSQHPGSSQFAVSVLCVVWRLTHVKEGQWGGPTFYDVAFPSLCHNDVSVFGRLRELSSGKLFRARKIFSRDSSTLAPSEHWGNRSKDVMKSWVATIYIYLLLLSAIDPLKCLEN